MLGDILEAFQLTIETYKNFSGTGMITVFFLAALLFLWKSEKDQSIRVIFVYLSAAVFALFLFPVFAYLAMFYFLDKEVYYRFLWLVPMGVLICYAAVRLLDRLEGWRKPAAGLVLAAFIMLEGSLVYANPDVRRAENPYHLPQAAIDVADVAGVDGEWVKAVVPSELVQFIRQYDSMIMMPYGREMLVDRWEMNHEMYMAMEADVIHAQYLVLLCQQEKVDYIVLRKSAQIGGSLEEYGFMRLTDVEGYDIYMDKHSAFYDRKREEFADAQ